MASQDVEPEPDHPTNFAASTTLLPPWERHLLQEVVFIQTEMDVWGALSTSQCFAASDGLAPKDRGSFAWVLSNANGDRLARCSGPVFSHSISSYRAEGYGILSFLRFLLLMRRIHEQVDCINSPHLVCDNQGLITMVTKLLTFSTIYPNTKMEAEWDCIAQILDSLQDLDTMAPSMAHVKGIRMKQCPMRSCHY